jgi:hypothetical protein
MLAVALTGPAKATGRVWADFVAFGVHTGTVRPVRQSLQGMPSRRDLIAGGTAAVTVALAGCLDRLGLTDSDSEELTAADWLVESAFGDTPVRVERPAQLAAIDGFDYASLFVGELPGLSNEAVDLQVGGRDGPFVLVGSFEAGTVVDGFGELSVQQPQSDGSYGGYDMYTDIRVTEGEGTLQLAVDEGRAVVATERSDLESILDASRGDATLLVDADSQFEQLQSSFEGAPFYQMQRPESERDVLLGVAADIGAGETTIRLVTVLGDTESAGTFGEELPGLLSGQNVAEMSVDVDGRTVRATGTRPTDQVPGVSAVAALFGPVLQYFGDTVGDGPVPPAVSFESDYDEGNETLTLTMQSGDTFTAGQVQFRGTGFDDTGASWDELAGDGVTAASDVSAGDQVQLQGVTPAFELDLQWISADGDDSAIIATFTGPDA